MTHTVANFFARIEYEPVAVGERARMNGMVALTSLKDLEGILIWYSFVTCPSPPAGVELGRSWAS